MTKDEGRKTNVIFRPLSFVFCQEDEMQIATKRDIERLFDGAAARYDREGPSVFRDWGARLVELMHWRDGARVLDVATGRGAVLIPAAQRVGARGLVVGVDLSDAMLHEAKNATQGIGLANVELCRMDAEHLAFRDETFDVVTCAFSLFFFPALAEALGEMRRVLRAGGTFGVTMFGTTPPPFDPAWRIFAEQMRAYDATVRMPGRVTYTPDDLSALLTQAGFARIETQLERYDVVFVREEDWWAFQFTLGSRAALLQMSDATRAKFKDEYLAQLRPLFCDDGLHLGVSVVYAVCSRQ
jgi:O-methyltransferase/aklanonic acid methyltransferase